MKLHRLAVLTTALACCAVASAQSKDAWRAHVSAADKAHQNPMAGDAANASAGERLYSEHCARCHGEQGQGIRKRPALTGADIAGATDGELFWLLRNGEISKGMPSWTTLPEAQRWQIITYVRTLAAQSPASTGAAH